MVSNSNWILKVNHNNYSYFTSTDTNGQYFFSVDTGINTIELISEIPYWAPCENPISVNVSPADDTVYVDFPLQINAECPFLTVDISTPFLRRCSTNIYSVNYCNLGTAPAIDTYIDIAFDPNITVDSSDVPWSNVIGNTYTFELDTIGIGECGDFKIYTSLSCDPAIFGYTHCVRAQIYSDTMCTPDSSLWTGPSIEVQAECDGDSAYFYIINSGMGDMMDYLNFIVVEDHLMLKPIPDSFLLNSSDTLVIVMPATGGTYYLGAEQAPGHPWFDFPSLTLEGCGTDSLGNVSLGFVNQFPQNDTDPFISVDCQENIGSWDPNDKRGFPEGYGPEHFIEKNTDIEYHIRFQNTGTDTAFKVEIRDTLSEFLDPSSMNSGPAAMIMIFACKPMALWPLYLKILCFPIVM